MAGVPSAKRLYDGIISCEGGIDSGKSPTVATASNPNGLARNQFSYATNCTMRGGRVKPRPGFENREIGTFDQEEGRYQGGFLYQGDNGTGCIVACIDGHFLRFNVGSDNSIVDITPSDGPNPSSRPQVWFYQAENFLIGQDGQTKPFIYDGGISRRAADDDVPVGTVGAYCRGRIWQARPDGVTFVAGDLVYQNGFRSDVLKFIDNTFLAGGGFFTIPANSGQIRAMQSMANIDTSLGQGPLLVMADNTICSVDAPFVRTEWQNLNYPIRTIAQITNGASGQYSTVLVNGDVFYRAPDGIRSFYVARRNFGQWANTPISREVSRAIDFDTKSLLTFGSAVVFDNRMLMTCSPVSNNRGVYHRGLAVLDFDLVSGMSYKLPPAWEGVWKGVNFLQVLSGRIGGKERCFAFVLSDESKIELWEITTDARFDSFPEETRITWSLELGSYTFEKAFQLKRLESGDLWIDRLAGEVDFTLQYRPDQHPCYLNWDTWSECAKYQDCETEECGTPIPFKEQYRPRKRFKSPDDSCNSTLNIPFVDGYEFQPKLTITGFCEIKQFRLQAFERTEPFVGECS